jgi:hypothetical protein
MEEEHRWVNAIYIAAIGLCLYSVIDQLMDGQLSRELGVWLTKTKGTLRYRKRDYEQFQKDLGKMLWQASETLEGK